MPTSRPASYDALTIRAQLGAVVRPGFDGGEIDRFHRHGWWADSSFGERITDLARDRPDDVAFVTPSERLTWRRYDETATTWAGALARLGSPGERVAVQLPDGPAVHVALIALERAGFVTVGIGARAGPQEVDHLIGQTGARIMIASASARVPAGIDHFVCVPDAPAVGDASLVVDGARIEASPSPTPLAGVDPDSLWLINSTSGTTGLPKCVMHNQNRWVYFHQLAVKAGGLDHDDVFLSALPTTFGFGIWTSHVSPMLLGAPTVVVDRFDAGAVLDLIERERVTVLGCVSTQFIMMLNEQAVRPRDLTSLRAMFTGGESVPYERAAEFEATTGASLLQFYGSNETGALSYTSRHSSRDRRLRSAGLVIAEMEVRLLDPQTHEDVTGRGQPACRGPAMCLGYWGDDDANTQLYTADGWMLMGDIVEIDDEGELSVVGRTSDFIIRGGKNISAAAVEENVSTHPGVAVVAAIAVPDPVFGERVAVYVEARGAEITLASITDHLRELGVSKEWFPEHLVVMESLPRSSGGKIAKGALREDARARFGAADATDA
ncbi:MAG: hypothetical protein JWN46_120 [Acidimicrobiales bacterium]|nr:hypothetical protein [Acidimicrobiales bacterium]